MQCGVAADSRPGSQLPPPGQRATARILAPKQAGPAVTSLLATVALHSPVTASFLYFSLFEAGSGGHFVKSTPDMLTPVRRPRD